MSASELSDLTLTEDDEKALRALHQYVFSQLSSLPEIGGKRVHHLIGERYTPRWLDMWQEAYYLICDNPDKLLLVSSPEAALSHITRSLHSALVYNDNNQPEVIDLASFINSTSGPHPLFTVKSVRTLREWVLSWPQ
jgi:hypothetical protein